MHSRRNKKRKAGGFTLGEVLATVAIIGILLAVAIPSALTIQKDLKLLELDNAARDIFIAAQNRLTALRASDGLHAVTGGGTACDIPPEDETKYAPLAAVDNTDGIFDVLLPARAIDKSLFDGAAKAVIVYNYESGSVYEVFYSEQNFTYEGGIGELRAKEKRRDNSPMIGYYGGDAVQVPGEDVIQPPAISLENGEELKLVIDQQAALNRLDAAAQQEYAAKVLPDLKYTIELQQADKPDNRAVYEQTGTAGALLSFNENVGTVVFDSVGGRHFAEFTDYKLDPGADITVSVAIEYTGNAFVARKYTWTGATNSLFAARGQYTKSAIDTTVIPGGVEVVEIACGRHLQNLEAQVSGLGQGPDKTGRYQPVHVLQTKDIDWSVHKEDTVTSYQGSSISAGAVEQTELAPKGRFLSIDNIGIGTFDGNGCVIKNLRIAFNKKTAVMDTKFQGAGLFARLSGTESDVKIHDVALVNPRLEGGEGTALGLLAGYTEKTTVTGCRVYLDDDVAAALKKEQTETEQYGIFSILDRGVAGGGLIGRAVNSTVSESFAALPKISLQGGFSYAGGLFGSLAGKTAVSECYASITALSAGSKVGGFVSEISETSGNVSISNCYATGTLDAPQAAGFVTGKEGTFNTCYAAVSYTDGFAKDKDIPFGPDNSGYTGCNYVTGIVDGPPAVSEQDEEKKLSSISYRVFKEKIEYGDIVNGARIWSGNVAKTTHGYLMQPFEKLADALKSRVEKTLYDDKIYPFPRLAKLDHYGDWPLPAKTGAFVYYEQYLDHTVGLAGVDAKGEMIALPANFLLSDEKTVTADGYAWMMDGEGPAKLLINGKEITQNKTLIAGKTCYALTNEMLMDETVGLRQVEIDGEKQNLWFDPHFAQSVQFKREKPVQTSVSVRTARHLVALGQCRGYWDKKYTYKQGRTIDYASYNWTDTGWKQVPIGAVGNTSDGGVTTQGRFPFTGIYDGGCYPILFTGMEENTHTGLFGINGGTLQNIVLRAAQEGTQIASSLEGNGSIGALAGINQGTITNCAAAGFSITGPVPNVGGLVGWNNGGTISGCAAASVSVSKGGYVGGLVGWNDGGIIQSCYALGKISGGTFNTAGISGLNDGSGRITDCISACALERGLAVGIGTTITNSFYLKDTAPTAYADSGVTGKTYAELQALALNGFAKADAAHTYPYSRTGAYPFPTSVTNAAGAPVHYGDWPEKTGKPDKTKVSKLGVAVVLKKDLIDEAKQLYSMHIVGYGVDENTMTMDYSKPEFELTAVEAAYSTDYFVYFHNDYLNKNQGEWGVIYGERWGISFQDLNDNKDLDTFRIQISESPKQYAYPAGVTPIGFGTSSGRDWKTVVPIDVNQMKTN